MNASMNIHGVTKLAITSDRFAHEDGRPIHTVRIKITVEEGESFELTLFHDGKLAVPSAS